MKVRLRVNRARSRFSRALDLVVVDVVLDVRDDALALDAHDRRLHQRVPQERVLAAEILEIAPIARDPSDAHAWAKLHLHRQHVCYCTRVLLYSTTLTGRGRGRRSARWRPWRRIAFPCPLPRGAGPHGPTTPPSSGPTGTPSLFPGNNCLGSLSRGCPRPARRRGIDARQYVHTGELTLGPVVHGDRGDAEALVGRDVARIL